MQTGLKICNFVTVTVDVQNSGVKNVSYRCNIF